MATPQRARPEVPDGGALPRPHAAPEAARSRPDDPHARETSGATTMLLLHHVRQRGGQAAVHRVVERAALPFTTAELQDPARWIGYHARIRLFEAAVEVLDDPRVAHDLGAEALHGGLNPSIVLLLRALGSPAQVYRQLPRSVPKFTTTSTMEVLSVSDQHARLRYTLHDGYPHSRLDCEYAQGLISVVPEIFGLPRAALTHTECQSDGHDACVYDVTWERRSRWWSRRTQQHAALETENAALRGQLEALQLAAGDLVGAADADDLLDRITERAAAAVVAPAHLLVLTDPHGGPPRVRFRGVDPGEVEGLVEALRTGRDLGRGAVVVDVTSRGIVHGHLAALYDEGQRGPAHERSLLRAYASHAAAALDLLHALEVSRRGEERSATLLRLAHDLRSATDPATVAWAAAGALPEILGSDTGVIFTYDPQDGALHALGFAGLDDDGVTALRQVRITPENAEELSTLLARQAPTLITRDNATPLIGAILTALDLTTVLAAPLAADGEVLGVATAGWRRGHVLHEPDEATAQLSAIAEYATTALENVHLLGRVRHQSMHDALTQLPNRVLFGQELARALQGAGTDAERVAVLFCDLDRFKHVNDVLGHGAGDEVLRQAADRLRASARPGDLVARLSGDEFALLLTGPQAGPAAQQVADRVVAALATPFRVEGLDLRVTTSVGIAVDDGSGAAPDTLMRAADRAMYSAKLRGRNQVARAMGRRADDRGRRGADRELASELRSAAADGHLRLHVQPIVRLTDADTRAAPTADAQREVEALLRWAHPRLGLLAPGAFLPLGEETGAIVDLDLWVVRQAATLLGSDPTLSGVSVNTSASTLYDPRWVSAVREALAAADVDPARLCVEVVESRSLADLPGVADRLRTLRRLGVRIALDDFGTGFSTLSWLQRLPVDRIKLDRSLTSDITHDDKAVAVAQGVLDLAGRLGIDVVAEGVETAEQLDAVRAAGFRLAQGYLWGKPGPLSSA